MSKNSTIILVVILLLVIIFWSKVKVTLINLGLFPMANVKLLYPKVSKEEGGIANVAGDTGGYTNRGVTIGTWQQLAPYLFGFQGTVDNLRTMTQAQWETVIKHFWDEVHADQIQNQGVAELLFDGYWGSGWYGPERMVKALNTKYGTHFNTDVNKTILPKEVIDFINSKNGYEVCQLFFEARKQHFIDISKTGNNAQFLNGWLHRLNDYQCKQTII